MLPTMPLLLAFEGFQVTQAMGAALETYRPAGVTLFRSLNLENAVQIRGLTEGLQRAAHQAGLPPLLIAADQEGGQLMAVGEATPLPGNMALGATRSPALARRAGEVLGRELAALGINVNYAPVCDVNDNPYNPVIGLRAFGEEPALVGAMAAAMVRGIQSAGVAATAKHFPGHGDTADDSHLGRAVLERPVSYLQTVAWPPFSAAVEAGVQMVMVGHVAVPAVDGADAPPATLSPRLVAGELRQRLGFDGVVVTDALNMRAIRQGEALQEEAVRALEAGNDLLLLMHDPDDWRRVHEGLTAAARRPAFAQMLRGAAQRLSTLRAWLARAKTPPDLDVVNSAPHRAVADEIARQAVTLVRGQRRLLPSGALQPGQRLGIVAVKPFDITPADTTSAVRYSLAEALRPYHDNLAEVWMPPEPTASDIDAVMRQARQWDYILIATQDAFRFPAQSALVRRVLAMRKPVTVVALRLPYDLMAFPEAEVFVCTYGLLPPNIKALAAALFGEIPFQGRLPVRIPGLYPVGHGIQE